MDTFEDARNEHFRGLVGRMAASVPVDTRCIDGTTQVGRSVLLSARERVVATASRARGESVVAGVAASILHGSLWFDAEFKIELLHPISGASRHGTGRITHRFQVAPTDVIELDGILVTTPVRTAFDVGRITPDWRGLGHLDALHRATRFSVADLCRYVEWHAGWRHIRQLRAIAPLIDGAAESPPESWLRLLMFRGGLPTPELQIEVADESGHVFARADIGYREEKVDIEYDGEEFHGLPWQRARDARRDAKLKALGWKVIRVDAERLRERPWTILTEIETALHRRRAY